MNSNDNNIKLNSNEDKSENNIKDNKSNKQYSKMKDKSAEHQR
jgi:hypothetical protein